MVVWITILYVWDIKYIIKTYNGYFKRKLPYEFLLEVYSYQLCAEQIPL
jgi:hypothetical protein